MRAFVFVGLLGAYTTFSTYGLETINLLREGKIGYAAFNLVASNVLGIGFIYFGLVLTKSLLNLLKQGVETNPRGNITAGGRARRLEARRQLI